MSICSNLINQFQTIKDLHEQLNYEVAGYSDSRDSLDRSGQITVLAGIFDIRKKLKLAIEVIRSEIYIPVIEASNFVSINGGEIIETKIKIDFNKILKQTKEYFKKNEIELVDDFEARAKEIWMRNNKEIMKEIATYGYDYVLIIPDILPSIEKLHEIATRGYPAANESGSFESGGSFGGTKESLGKVNTFRLVLVHEAKSLQDNPVLNSTIDKSLAQLISNGNGELADDRLQEIKRNRENIKINFNADGLSFGSSKDRLGNKVMAEGLSLTEYLIYQAIFDDKHLSPLDEGEVFTLLPASFNNSGFIFCRWKKQDALGILASNNLVAFKDSGCRLCRSFT